MLTPGRGSRCLEFTRGLVDDKDKVESSDAFRAELASNGWRLGDGLIDDRVELITLPHACGEVMETNCDTAETSGGNARRKTDGHMNRQNDGGTMTQILQNGRNARTSISHDEEHAAPAAATARCRGRDGELRTAEDAMRRWPILTAHMICESLGYFSPHAAAQALLDHHKGRASFSEWYMSRAGRGVTMLDVGRNTIRNAIRGRHHHHGYMADYQRARALVAATLERGAITIFGSWT